MHSCKPIKIYAPDPQHAPRQQPQPPPLPVCPSPPPPPPPPPPRVNYNPDDFVHVAFQSGSAVQSYVGQVVTAEDEEYKVSFLRSANYRNKTFVFLIQEDKVCILPEQVIRKLDFQSTVEDITDFHVL